MIDLNSVAIQFYNAGIKYSSAIQPYALKLFFALFLIDIIVTWIQYTAEGQLDPSYFLGRMLKHILSGGFIYLMIVNAFTWMNAVITSFSDIGAAVSGLPNLSPQSVLQLGGKMAQTIFDAPASTSVMSNLEMAIIQSVSGFVVLLAFTITAIALLFTLVESYIAIGGGVILLGFGGSRFTAPAAEGLLPIRHSSRRETFVPLPSFGCGSATRDAMGCCDCCGLQSRPCSGASHIQLLRSTLEDHYYSLFRGYS